MDENEQDNYKEDGKDSRQFFKLTIGVRQFAEGSMEGMRIAPISSLIFHQPLGAPALLGHYGVAG